MMATLQTNLVISVDGDAYKPFTPAYMIVGYSPNGRGTPVGRYSTLDAVRADYGVLAKEYLMAKQYFENGGNNVMIATLEKQTDLDYSVVWGVSASELPTLWPHIADFGQSANKRYAVQLYFTVGSDAIDTGSITIYRNGVLLATLPTLDYSSGSAASDTGYDTPQGYTEVLNDGSQLKIAYGFGVDAHIDGTGEYVVHVGAVVSEPYIIVQPYTIDWGFRLFGVDDPQFDPRVLPNNNDGVLIEHKYVLFLVFCVSQVVNTGDVIIYKDGQPWHTFPSLDMSNGEAQTGTYGIDRYAASIDPETNKMIFAHEWGLPSASEHNGTYKISINGVESTSWQITN